MRPNVSIIEPAKVFIDSPRIFEGHKQPEEIPSSGRKAPQDSVRVMKVFECIRRKYDVELSIFFEQISPHEIEAREETSPFGDRNLRYIVAGHGRFWECACEVARAVANCATPVADGQRALADLVQ